MTKITLQLAIFAVAAVPGYILASSRANELISAWNIPASSCLGCGERGRGAVMVVALFLWPTIRSPAFPQARDFKASL